MCLAHLKERRKLRVPKRPRMVSGKKTVSSKIWKLWKNFLKGPCFYTCQHSVSKEAARLLNDQWVHQAAWGGVGSRWFRWLRPTVLHGPVASSLLSFSPCLTGSHAEGKSFLGFSTQFSHLFNDNILKRSHAEGKSFLVHSFLLMTTF